MLATTGALFLRLSLFAPPSCSRLSPSLSLPHTLFLLPPAHQVAFDFGGGARAEVFDAVVNDNVWHIVAVSWDQGVVSVRLDGFALGFVAGMLPSAAHSCFLALHRPVLAVSCLRRAHTHSISPTPGPMGFTALNLAGSAQLRVGHGAYTGLVDRATFSSIDVALQLFSPNTEATVDVVSVDYDLRAGASASASTPLTGFTSPRPTTMGTTMTPEDTTSSTTGSTTKATTTSVSNVSGS